jgi:hypothetical protein
VTPQQRNGLAVAWGLGVFLSSPAVSATEWHMVAVGNNLGHGDETPLHFAEQDADRFAAVMKRLGAVPARNTVTMLGESASALRKVLLSVNAQLRQQSTTRTPGTGLLVFFSGHADARGLHLGETVLPFDELKELVEDSPATTRVLIVDACRSGGVTRVKGARPADEFDITLVDRSSTEGMVVITSSTAGEDSYESANLRASLFSHHLVNALRGAADADRDGAITLTEAYRYTYRQTLRSSGRTAKLQHPTFEFGIKGKGDLVLARLVNDRNRSARLLISEPGLYLVYENDPAGRLWGEVVVEEPGTRLIMPTGDFLLQWRGAESFREYRVELTAGREVDLDNVAYQSMRYARLLRRGGGQEELIHGLFALGAVRDGIVAGQGSTPHIVFGTSLDLPWLTFGLRLRLSHNQMTTVDGMTATRHYEVGLGVTTQRYFDLSWFSVAVGLVIEGTFLHQNFATAGVAPARNGWGLGFGGLFTVERELWSGLALQLEGGPLTQLLRRSVTRVGAESGSTLASPLVFWLAAGLGWRF